MSIKIDQISKSFKSLKALQNISLEVKKGELFGLIGPDGAGKTTLFRILTTLLLPDSGVAKVDHLDILSDFKVIRECVGYMPGRFSLYQDLTVEENLHFFATIFGTTLEKNYELIKDIYIQLEPFKNRRAGKLSGGMKQKLALCCALIHRPKVLFLDEPTTGVDPVSRKEFWEMLKRLQQSDLTILVSTPYMDEAELCDRIALIQEGKILKVEKPDIMVRDFPKKIFNVVAQNRHQLITLLNSYEFMHSSYPFGEFLHYIDKRKDFNPSDLKMYLNSNGISEAHIEPTRASIEDTFMELARR